MDQISDLPHFLARQTVVQPTSREAAESWIRTLSADEPVEDAQTEAEVQFRSEESAANWRESLRNCDFPLGLTSHHLLPHWRAGAEYTKRVCLGYGAVAAMRIRKPAELDSFLQESLAILAEKTYREKLQPYDGLTGEAVSRAVIHFYEFVRTVAAKEVGELGLAAWKRHREQRRQRAARTAEAADADCAKAEQSATTGTERQMLQGDATPQPVESTVTAATGEEIAAGGELRLAAFMHQHNISKAEFCRAAKVWPSDLRRWCKAEMKSTSVMAQRIENVLSSRTALLPKDGPKG